MLSLNTQFVKKEIIEIYLLHEKKILPGVYDTFFIQIQALIQIQVVIAWVAMEIFTN